MNLPTSDTTGLADVKVALEPFDKLWNLLFQWNKSEKNWMHGPIFKFDGNEIEAEVDNMFKSAYSLHNLFKDTHREPADVAAYVFVHISPFSFCLKPLPSTNLLSYFHRIVESSIDIIQAICTINACSM
jgi:hypothetical protein